VKGENGAGGDGGGGAGVDYGQMITDTETSGDDDDERGGLEMSGRKIIWSGLLERGGSH
jgi:hypothetical protein